MNDRLHHVPFVREARALFGLLLIAVAVAAPAGAEVDVDRRIPASADGTVEVELVSGSLEIRGWDGDEVEVTGTIGDEVEELRVESREGRVRIEVMLPRRSGSWRGGVTDAHLKIQLPRFSELEVESVSADLDVAEVAGRTELETVSGVVELTGAGGEAEVETVSGRIATAGDFEELRATTVSGHLELRGDARQAHAKSVSGRASLELDLLDQVEAQTVSGRLSLAGALASGARVEAQSHSGALTLSVPRSSSARFVVQTFSGGIHNALGPAARRTDRHGPGKHLEFTLGGGGAEVRLNAFSGSVSIEER